MKTLQDENSVYIEIMIFKILSNNNQNINVNIFENIFEYILHHYSTQNTGNFCRTTTR